MMQDKQNENYDSIALKLKFSSKINSRCRILIDEEEYSSNRMNFERTFSSIYDK